MTLTPSSEPRFDANSTSCDRVLLQRVRLAGCGSGAATCLRSRVSQGMVLSFVDDIHTEAKRLSDEVHNGDEGGRCWCFVDDVEKSNRQHGDAGGTRPRFRHGKGARGRHTYNINTSGGAIRATNMAICVHRRAVGSKSLLPPTTWSSPGRSAAASAVGTRMTVRCPRRTHANT